ncbi:hypothetical protein CR513_34153, partial [Mucuna pruriens]
MEKARESLNKLELIASSRDVGISKGLEIIEYSNSDFAGCQDSKRSTSGYIYMLAGGAISWKSIKQALIAPSTMK